MGIAGIAGRNIAVGLWNFEKGRKESGKSREGAGDSSEGGGIGRDGLGRIGTGEKSIRTM